MIRTLRRSLAVSLDASAVTCNASASASRDCGRARRTSCGAASGSSSDTATGPTTQPQETAEDERSQTRIQLASKRTEHDAACCWFRRLGPVEIGSRRVLLARWWKNWMEPRADGHYSTDLAKGALAGAQLRPHNLSTRDGG